MINGGSSDEVSYLLYPKSYSNEVSPNQSQYSSCGESEFDRYCSANSFMETPSLCGSLGTFHECFDSEFGSLKSFGLCDIKGVENFKLEGNLDKSNDIDGKFTSLSTYERNIDFHPGMSIELYDNGESSLSHKDEFSTSGKDGNENLGSRKKHSENGILQSAVEIVCNERNMIAEPVECDIDGINLNSYCQLDEEYNVSGEDESSSRYDHSEGEDSMYNYGSGADNTFNLHHMESIQNHQNVKSETDNPLVMNPSIAFGSDDWDDFVQETREGDMASLIENYKDQKQMNFETERKLIISTLATISESEKQEYAISTVHSNNIVEGIGELNAPIMNFSKLLAVLPDPCELEHGNLRKPETKYKFKVTDGSTGHKNCTVSKFFEFNQVPLEQKTHLRPNLNAMDEECQNLRPDMLVGIEASQLLESQLGKSTSELDPLSNTTAIQVNSSTLSPENKIELSGDNKHDLAISVFKGDNILMTLDDSSKDQHESSNSKVEHLELDPFYDDVVLEMEDILLDADVSPGARFHQSNIFFQSSLSMPPRDGGTTASTSGAYSCHLPFQSSLRIDHIEVVGAKQKKGDVSFGERLVGVKEFTLYKLSIWSGKERWEVERRYRDFSALYRRLKSFYTDQGWILPFPWSTIERESRKLFGNASPDVVAQRSILIQECLQSIIHSRCSSSLPGALIWFLSPQKSVHISASNYSPFTVFNIQSTIEETVTDFGKTLSLIVETYPDRSLKQLLEAQHYTCAGCRKYFDGKTRLEEFVQAFGWGKPRVCEYTGQLFCTSCHINDTAVLPARVLHHWDFSVHLVSQLAKSYLDSISDQPMLCVSVVNPVLFSKVPTLLRIMSARKKIAAVLPIVRCPFIKSIHKGLGSRRYLLESNDFFALRDLVDLSKGAFAALPIMVESVLRKILEHITEQCLLCCDAGAPCGARQACDDMSSLIFPFQEDEVDKCSCCKLVFHKPCLKRLTKCPCGVLLNSEKNVSEKLRIKRSEGTIKRESKSYLGFLSGVFSLGSNKSSDTIMLDSFPPTTSP